MLKGRDIQAGASAAAGATCRVTLQQMVKEQDTGPEESRLHWIWAQREHW